MFEMTALRQPRVRPYRYSRFNPDFVLIFGAGGSGRASFPLIAEHLRSDRA
jgi:hypothetical protein